MATIINDNALVHVLSKKLVKYQLPRLLFINKEMELGNKLNRFDLPFLKQNFKDDRSLSALVERHPEWQPVISKIVTLYRDITIKALENEQQSIQPTKLCGKR
jgi:hypothetical protein